MAYNTAVLIHRSLPTTHCPPSPAPRPPSSAPHLKIPPNRTTHPRRCPSQPFKPVMPPHTAFPYTVRIASEVTSSNGSSSMATACAASLAMLDAGVPIAAPVAGVSVGLVSETDPSSGDITKYQLLTDILGLEDHYGDMDFKVAGTRDGITAVQLDVKLAGGVPLEILCEGLDSAMAGRLHILDAMD